MAASDKSALGSAHDLDLTALAKGGDRRACRELVRRHGSAVRGLVRRAGADPALADRIARDAFLDAFERISDFRGEMAFQAWVKRIAAQRYGRRWRRERRRSAVEDDADLAPARDLDAALRRLPPAERVCVGLCYGGGLSHAEAADALKLPLGIVKSHVRGGLDRLRAGLAPGSGGSGGASRRRADG